MFRNKVLNKGIDVARFISSSSFFHSFRKFRKNEFLYVLVLY